MKGENWLADHAINVSILRTQNHWEDDHVIDIFTSKDVEISNCVFSILL